MGSPGFSGSLLLAPGSVLSDDPIRSQQHVVRNPVSDPLRGFKIDSELKFDGSFDGKAGKVCSFRISSRKTTARFNNEAGFPTSHRSGLNLKVLRSRWNQ
jgi:hypothetical protein